MVTLAIVFVLGMAIGSVAMYMYCNCLWNREMEKVARFLRRMGRSVPSTFEGGTLRLDLSGR